MVEPTRRDVIVSSAAVVGGGLLAAAARPALAADQKSKELRTVTDELPAFRFPIEKQTPKTGEGGSAREASAVQFPVSKGIAGVSMFLAAGTMRELHWHANAAEWAYVISGNCRATVHGPGEVSETVDFGPGDIWYFPRGHGHSIQGLGPGDCHFILVFDNGYFSEFATFSFSDWLGHTPHEVLAKNLHVAESTFADFPTKEVYFARGPVPGPLSPPAARAAADASLSLERPAGPHFSWGRAAAGHGQRVSHLDHHGRRHDDARPGSPARAALAPQCRRMAVHHRRQNANDRVCLQRPGQNGRSGGR